MREYKSTTAAASVRLLVTLAAATACLALAACEPGASPNAKRYEIKGKVVHVDQRGNTVTIAHEEIRDYMQAMTMAFKLKDPWPLKEMQPGDIVSAVLVVDGSRSWLEEVVFARIDRSESGGDQISHGPQIGDEVPDFSLVNQDGKRLTIHGYRGRALALTFIYTRCPLPDYCPLMSQNFTEIERELQKAPAQYEKTRLLSVSVDPAFDTPKVLRSYGQALGLQNFDHWEFASGSADEVKKAAGYFGLQYREESDQIIHSLETAIITPDGRLARLYRGNEWKPAEVLADLRNVAAGEIGFYNGEGVIESLDRAGSTIEIAHSEIKDFMPAMTMPFQIKPESLISDLAPGDKVEFTFESSGEGMVIVQIKKK